MSRGVIAIAILVAAGSVNSSRGQSMASISQDELRSDGANKWSSIGPEGGPIAALSVDPHKGAIFAATSGLAQWVPAGASFQSVDRGASWAPSNVPSGVLIFDPQDPNTIYPLDSGIAKSMDGGTSWKPANSGLPPEGFAPPEVDVLAIDPLNPSTLYAGTYDGVFKSTDGGATWNPASTGLPPTDPEGYYSSVHGLTIDSSSRPRR